MFLITFYSNECLSIKGAEQLRVPSPWLVFLMLNTVKMVCSVVENFVDDEGALPSRGKLVWFLERLDPSHFWRGIDASLADKWSTGSRPSLFPPLRDRLNLARPALLPLRRLSLIHI